MYSLTLIVFIQVFLLPLSLFHLYICEYIC